MKLVIARSPTAIKSLLFQLLEQKQTWETFLKTAEETAWMAYPDKNQIDQPERHIGQMTFPNRRNFNYHRNTYRNFPYRQNNRNQRNPRQYCSYHGQCNHNTAQCFVLASMDNNNKDVTKRAKVNQINRAMNQTRMIRRIKLLLTIQTFIQ